MIKSGFLGCLLAVAVFGNVQAQIMGGSSKAVVQKEKTVVKVEKENISSAKAAANTINIEEEIPEEDVAPVAMTPEQKAEIDIAAKKSLKMPLKRQNLRDRKDFVQAMTTGERIQKRRSALIEGKTDAQADKIAREIEFPEINLISNTQMEKYMYQKAGLENEK